MATLCNNCGTALKEGARYCGNCGTLIPSHPLSPQSLSAASRSGGQDDSTADVMHEQAALPSWMSQLDSGTRNHSKASSDELKLARSENSSKYKEAGQVEKTLEKPTVDRPEKAREGIKNRRVTEIPTVSWPVPPVPQLDFPAPQSVQQPDSSPRELHIKVWEQEEPAIHTPGEMPLSTVGKEERGIEHLPTSPLGASLPENAIEPASMSTPAARVSDAHFDEVEQLDTLPLATPSMMKPAIKEAGHQPDKSLERPTHQIVPTFAPPNAHSTIQPVQRVQAAQEHSGIPSLSPIKDLKQTPHAEVSVVLPRHYRSRRALTVTLVSLLLLIMVGGTVAWIVLSHPFSVPGITQPQQSFKNAQFGFSLLYPSGWTSQVEQSKVTVHFYDSSRTAQVNIVVGPSNGGDLSHYLQLQASQLGMTGQKTVAPLSFAGATWQQLRGNVLQRGASYTETLLVAVHNQHLFTIMLLAPQTTYSQEDQLVFSGMRSSFRFI